jgi:hypothetical protein
VVVTGFLGLLPGGGGAWDYIQYPLGFRELGCDVLYLEDTGLWPIFHHCSGEVTCDMNVAYIQAAMRRVGMDGSWAYRDEVTGRYFGMDETEVRRFCSAADVFVNVSCSTPLREEYARIPIRALIDTDPMFTQVQCATGRNLYGRDSSLPAMVTQHTHLFTFGERFGQTGCQMPSESLRWRPTRQPIVMKHWPACPLPASNSYTSVFNWSICKDFEFLGRTWGQKNTEFLRFADVPSKAPEVSFRIAVGQTTGEPFPAAEARSKGWEVLDPASAVPDMETYQAFIQKSHAEFSVAKHTYVQANCGWFSCRSACYLASGRPVVTQDTGWSSIVPNGRGLFAFTNEEEALAAIHEIERDPRENAQAARNIAEEAFDSNRVLSHLLAELGA